MKPMIKQLTDQLNQKQLFPLLTFGVVVLLVWYGGPLITVGTTTPLVAPEKRFYTIAALLLAWVLKKNFLSETNTAHFNTTPLAFINPDLAKKIQGIESRFQGALRFLKKTMLNKQGKNSSLYQLPWYLLIVPAHAGKTSLLANANINFILAKQFKPEILKNIPASDVCDWWVTRDAVMVDVPSHYLSAKQKILSTNSNQKAPSTYAVWHGFLTLVKKYRGKKALSGVILALPAAELMTGSSQERLFTELQQQITEARAQFGAHLPFFLTLTKCDQIPGFIDFFSDSGSDELAQAWGVTLPALKDNENLPEVFGNRFNALIKRLNKQLIWRLHQERNPFTRPQIKDFPLQIERLKDYLANALKIIAPDANFNLQGVYLTSALQQTPQDQEHATQLTAAPNLAPGALQIFRAPALPPRTFFVRQLLLQALLATGQPSAADPRFSLTLNQFNWRNHKGLTAAVITGGVLVAGFLGSELQQSIKQTYAIRDGLAQYEQDVQQASQQTPHLAQALLLLNALHQTATSNTLLPYTDKAQQSAAIAYNQALKIIVLPQIRYDLETYLAATNNKNPEALYVALKAYLMLGVGQHLQPDFVFATLQQINPELFNQQNSAELSSHIHAALNTAWQALALDDTLVARARKRLSTLMPLDLSWSIVKSLPAYSANNTFEVAIKPDQHHVLIDQPITAQIPKLYTADAFQDVYDRQITAATREVTQGSWVLGGATTTVSTESLLAQLRTLYLTNYVSAWESLLQNATLITPTNLTEAAAQIEALSRADSPLLQLFITIRENASFAPIAAVSPKLAAINAFVASPSSEATSPLHKTFAALNQAHTDLQTLLGAADIPDAAFNIGLAHSKAAVANKDVISLLFNTAENTPAPLKNWLTSIATKSWHFVLQAAAQHIEQRWTSNVFAVYTAQLANHFPFSATATKEISLEQFTKFLGTHGIMTSFYQTYLAPFVEVTPHGWAWKSLHNEQLPFSAVALASFERAADLQHTFFPNADDQLALKFTLQPLNMENDATLFELSLNQQNVEYEQGDAAVPETLVWPGNKNVRLTALTMTLQGKTRKDKTPPVSNVNLNGDWGWFRLVNKSTLKVVSAKQLLISFDVNGHKIKYNLFTQTHLNPFVLTNFENFRIPQQLSDEA